MFANDIHVQHKIKLYIRISVIISLKPYILNSAFECLKF